MKSKCEKDKEAQLPCTAYYSLVLTERCDLLNPTSRLVRALYRGQFPSCLLSLFPSYLFFTFLHNPLRCAAINSLCSAGSCRK